MAKAVHAALYLRGTEHNALADDWCDIERRITMNLNSLVRIISLPSEMAVHQVGQFVLAYCDYQLSSLERCQDNDSHTLRVLINRTINNHPLFVAAEASNQPYMTSLQQAYFTLRVLEEAGDRYRQIYRQPLSAHDLSTANLIVYCLLGEHQASALDSLAAAIVSSWEPLGKPQQAHPDSALVHICQNWPCLASSLGLPSLLMAD